MHDIAGICILLKMTAISWLAGGERNIGLFQSLLNRSSKDFLIQDCHDSRAAKDPAIPRAPPNDTCKIVMLLLNCALPVSLTRKVSRFQGVRSTPGVTLTTRPTRFSIRRCSC